MLVQVAGGVAISESERSALTGNRIHQVTLLQFDVFVLLEVAACGSEQLESHRLISPLLSLVSSSHRGFCCSYVWKSSVDLVHWSFWLTLSFLSRHLFSSSDSWTLRCYSVVKANHRIQGQLHSKHRAKATLPA